MATKIDRQREGRNIDTVKGSLIRDCRNEAERHGVAFELPGVFKQGQVIVKDLVNGVEMELPGVKPKKRGYAHYAVRRVTIGKDQPTTIVESLAERAHLNIGADGYVKVQYEYAGKLGLSAATLDRETFTIEVTHQTPTVERTVNFEE